MFTVKFMPGVIDDLRGIAAFIAMDKPIRALTFVQEIERKANDMLSMAPNSGKVYKGQTRYFPVSGYVVLYEVDDTRNVVNVLHIVSSRMDWKK